MSRVRIIRLCLTVALIASAPAYGQQNIYNREGRLRATTSLTVGQLVRAIDTNNAGLSTPADDVLMVGNASTWQDKTLPDCDDTGGNHINYDTTANAFTCGTSGGGGGSGDVTDVGNCTTGACFMDGTNAGTELVYEGTTVNTNETRLAFSTDPGADYVVTIPNETGTLCTTFGVCTGYQAGPLSGDVVTSGAAATIQANSVALTTDTTGSYAAGDAEAGNATGLACTDCVALTTETSGNYVASVATSAPLTGGAAGSEGATLTLACTTASSGVTGCLSGANWTTFNAKQDGPLSGDVVTSGAAATIQANSVALGTDTTNDYIASATCGAGTSCTATGEGSTPTIITASSEADFLASGALTCGASTRGKMQVHTTPLQYCDNAATPALQYAAYGNSTGEATSIANTAVSLTADVTGILPIANGGMGPTYTDDSLLIANGSTFQLKTLTTCTGTGKAVTYDAATNAFNCNTNVSDFTGDAGLGASGATIDVAGSEGVTTSAGASTLGVEWSPETRTGNITLWSGASATRTLTASLSGATDPYITFGDNSVDVIANLKQGGAAVSLAGHAHATTDLTSGTLTLARGGTNASNLNASPAKCVRINAGGTALEAAAADCATGGVVTGLTADSGGTTTGATITLTGGAGITTTRATDTVTIATASTKAAFLSTSAITCGAATSGKASIAANVFTWCDAAGTAAIKYAAFAESDGGANYLRNSADCSLVLSESAPCWDSDDNLLSVGDGATRKTLVDTSTAQTLAGPKTLTSPVITCTDCVTDTNVADITLGSGTAGNYVASATASQGLTLTGTEGASLGLQDCAANEVLQRNAGDTAWACATAGVGTVTGSGIDNEIARWDGSTAIQGTNNWSIDDTGIMCGNVVQFGVGTCTVPHGGVGYAKLAIEGTNASSAGPHVQYTTATDNYPVRQDLNWSHDNVVLCLDCYYDGQFRSSDAGSNFVWYKGGGDADELNLFYDTGIAQGSAMSLSKSAMMVNSTSLVLNEDGLDRDFRIETDTNTNALVLDAGAETLAIGVPTSGATTTTATSGFYNQIIGTATFNPASASTLFAVATNGTATYASTTASTGMTGIGVAGQASKTNTGAAGSLFGVYAKVSNTNATGSAQLGAGVYIAAADTTGSFATLWGLFQAGTEKNSFGGQVIFPNTGVDFTQSDTNPSCAAGDYLIYSDLSETKLKKCENGTATDLDTGGGGGGLSHAQVMSRVALGL